MCVISCFKTVPSLEDLEDMTEQNPHGNGFSIRTKENKIEFFKGRNLSPEKILEIIKNYGFNQGDEVEFVFHARITSHGSTCDELECDFENPNKNHVCGCHGFIISEDMENPQRATIEDTKTIAMYHNGTMDFDKLKEYAKKIIVIRNKHTNKKLDVENLVSDTHALSFIVANLGIEFFKKFAEKEKHSKFCLHSLENGIERFNGFQEQNKNISCSNLYHTWNSRRMNEVVYDSWNGWAYAKTSRKVQKEDKNQTTMTLFNCPFENKDCVHHEDGCMTQSEYDMMKYYEGEDIENLSREFQQTIGFNEVEKDYVIVKEKNKMNKQERKKLRKQKRMLKKTTSIRANNANYNRWRELKRRQRGYGLGGSD